MKCQRHIPRIQLHDYINADFCAQASRRSYRSDQPTTTYINLLCWFMYAAKLL